jgi:hypothetical protein
VDNLAAERLVNRGHLAWGPSAAVAVGGKAAAVDDLFRTPQDAGPDVVRVGQRMTGRRSPVDEREIEA